MWKNFVHPDRQQRKYGACVLRAGYLRLQTHTQNMYVILIAFPLQECLHERASMLRYTYFACMVKISLTKFTYFENILQMRFWNRPWHKGSGRLLGSFSKFRKATIGFVMSGPSTWKNSVPTESIIKKSYIWVFFENLSRKFKFLSNLKIIRATLHEDRYTYMIISRLIILRMRNISDEVYNRSTSVKQRNRQVERSFRGSHRSQHGGHIRSLVANHITEFKVLLSDLLGNGEAYKTAN